jgi:LysR family transcriptional regulator, transcription activator of glutamate synthase operon
MRNVLPVSSACHHAVLLCVDQRIEDLDRSLENLDRQIRYFVKIAELKSLSKAADSLDLTQSGLSRQLAALEAYIGKPLFSRTGRGVEPTGAGKFLLNAAKSAYVMIDDAIETVREKEGVTQGNVRLATVHTLSYYFTADVVSAFVGARPHVNLSLMGRSSPEVVELVETGKADIGFVYDAAVASADVISIPLFEDEMCLIIGEDSSVKDGVDLTVAPPRLVGFPKNYALRKMLESSGMRPEFAAEAETVDAMLRLIASGVGACVLPSRMPDGIVRDYKLKKVSISKPLMKRRVVAVIRADRHPTGLIKQLLETAVMKVPQGDA